MFCCVFYLGGAFFVVCFGFGGFFGCISGFLTCITCHYAFHNNTVKKSHWSKWTDERATISQTLRV